MDRNTELSEFLRSRRARLGPGDAGVHVSNDSPRRVPGLRREELAQLAGVSTDYYTRLEQGRHLNVSEAVLDAVARALQLNDTERAYLFELTRPRPRRTVRRRPPRAQRVRPGVHALLRTTHIVVDENYVLRIPEGISLDIAAPLLCAGITLYSPLAHWNAGPGKNVAIIGLGGLGHMGVKIAHAMGAEVTVLSQTLRKKDDGLRLGADHFYATGDEATFTELAGTFDLIVNTTSANLPLDGYLSLLKRDGTLVHVGAPENLSAFNQFSLIGARKTMAGSKIGGIRQTQEMLDFCAEHGLGAEIELIDGEQINEAYDRVVSSDVRYRFVIDIASFKA
ncbi:helix-turn-helix domain-containing protein [Streptomyces malaysiensis subsp. malaysiensis]|uniref:zinc-binding dehydrogenase n=1 Tax=Streptomyces malaysiensis TaxID=92644 RepID=UPI000BFC21CE|nr:zinc-binding dehydrogenase [Streptomyces malaysiensis]ATL83224.1 hypothetical protein SMALA_2990 [Streptomyces malaysiensis]QDL72607.1 helix-turn-helix domain-containing protein [Streptomyces malaysiensis]